MSKLKIGSVWVGEGRSPFTIAEAGVNHNGDIKKAFEMIEKAKEAGANAVKFQTFKAEEFVVDRNITYSYKSQGKDVTESMYEMFKRYEFSKGEWESIQKKCKETGILFLSTAQNPSDLNLLLELGVPALKVGSDDFNNTPLLKEYAKTKLPLIVSCGMSDLNEINESISAIGALKGYPTILLLCTSQYPTPPEDVNLEKLNTLKKEFPNVVLGFSDHTQGPLASSLATALGAKVFEKHFTLDNNLPGPDHWFSENPESLKIWVQSIHKASSMLGSAELKPTAAELEVKKIARRSIVALRNIKEGEKFNLENIGLMRPGDGLPPSQFEKILGLKATRSIENKSRLKEGDFKK